MSDAEKKQLLNLMYVIFKNDVGENDFDFGCELMFEYVNSITNNPEPFN